MSAWALSSPAYWERDDDPADQRDQLARQRHAEAVREAEEELQNSGSGQVQSDDWRVPAIVARVKAEADRRAAQTGARVPAAIVWAAVEALDLVLEGLAQANIRPEDAAPFADLPAMCLSAVGIAWQHADERARE